MKKKARKERKTEEVEKCKNTHFKSWKKTQIREKKREREK